jgi:spermidine/putrescine-binding protein
MKRYLVFGLTVGAAFFCFGLGWGAWNKRRQADALARSTPLRVLCAENWLSNATLEKFSQTHSVRIQQWTYARPSEFLRQMANADGKVDVICASSMLVRSLIHSHWIRKMEVGQMENAKLISVDFTHLPYDPADEYTVPLFWNLLGFFGRDEPPYVLSWKRVWQTAKIALWGDELNILHIMSRLGLNIESRLEEEPDRHTGKTVDDDIRRLSQSAVHFIKPAVGEMAGEDEAGDNEWIQVPVARVARMMSADSDLHFWLPEDGAIMDLGVLSVGDKSTQPELAVQLINELVSTGHALEAYERLHAGVVHNSLSGLNTIAPLQKPEALRKFPLNQLQFPDLSLDALPRFEKIFDETIAKQY